MQIVMGQSSTALQQAASKPDMIHAGANLVNGALHGTLVLDRLGRILSCGAPAEKIFGASQVRLVGRWISEFIGGLFLAGSSPSYNTRYLVYLCADGEWRKFEARDADGQGFEVELNLPRVMTDEQEIFLLNLRGPEDDTHP
ncbi:MAG: PAS domain-containing protein [Rhodocyclales bacterium]|nr:PAS domain-containing protein [Rhodocyclales bacterium]